MARVYNFQLPHFVPGMYVSAGIDMLKSADQWQHLPPLFRSRLENGAGMFGDGVQISKADCDAIPTDTWTVIADKLNLEWSEA